MPRTSLVLTGVIFAACALILCGCGSDGSVQEGSSSRSIESSAATEGGDLAGDGEAPISTGGSSAVAETTAHSGDPTTDAPGATRQTTEQPPALASAVVETDTGDERLTDVEADDAAEGGYELEGDDGFEDEPLLDAYEPRTSPAGLRVTRAYICRGIEESEPTDAGRSFLPKEDGINRLCCFSEIAGAAAPDSVWHVWYWGEREMGRVGLEVRSSRWRTWSRKQVLDEWKGEWHVDIVDSEDFLLYRLEFSIE